MFFFFGRTHGAPYRGYGYLPLRFGGGGGNVVRRMGTQQQQVYVLREYFEISVLDLSRADCINRFNLDKFSIVS